LEGIYLIIGVIIAIMVVLFLWMDRRWKKLFDEQKTDPSSQVRGDPFTTKHKIKKLDF
jgi:FtsZ-interacting cell division protein ZipA